MTTSLAAALEADGLPPIEDAPGGLSFPVVAPDEVEGIQRAVQRANRDGLRVLPLGGGSSLARLRPEALAADSPYQLGISTRELQGIDYEPGDGTAGALSGTLWAELERTVAAGGHRLTPWLPASPSRSVGGVVAAGDSGPDRLRIGPLRHHLLGTEVVAATGEHTRSGGQLVKNVTGYDLHRLHCGSRGTLAILTRAAFRLFPAPETSVWLTVANQDPRLLLTAEEELRGTDASPTATWLTSVDGKHWELDVLLDGRERAVASARERALGILGPDAEEHQDPAERVAHCVQGELSGGRPARLRLSCLPSQVGGGAIDNLQAFCQARELPFGLLIWPGVGQVDVFLPESPDAAGLIELRDQVAAAEVRLQALELPPELVAVLRDSPEGTDPVERAWMERLLRTYDPNGLLGSPLFP